MDERTLQAARNNAVWCDCVCRAHRRPGGFHDGIWLNAYPAPPLYPNAVTTEGERAAPEQTRLIRELSRGLRGEWAVKDSFCALDLAGEGFRRLFEASWIYRAAAQPVEQNAVPGVRWRRLAAPEDLAAWERAWRGGETEDPGERQFPPSLLAEDDVAFLAAFHPESGRIVAGCVANRAAGVAGLSNVFVPDDGEAAGFWAGCAAAAVEAFPGLPLVGYESGAALEQARGAGFAVIGSLRVWLRSEAP